MPDVVHDLREAATGAFSRTPVVFAYLFGSHATGRTYPWSDVDIAVMMGPDWDGEVVETMLDLAGRIEAAARVGNVDVLILNRAPLRLQGRVLREGKKVYSCDEPARVAWASRTFREWADFEYHAAEIDRAYLKAIAEGRR